MKKTIKNILSKVVYSDINSKRAYVLSHSVLSLDIFDTAIKRNVLNPDDIYEIVERRCNREGIPISGFSKKRKKAEAEARKFFVEKEEINLDDIYFFLDEIKDNQKSFIKEIEKKTEYDYATANSKIREIYDEFIKRGKKVIFTSDMYLPLELIESILKKCGYDKYDKIYLSSEIGKCKHTGKIYDVMLIDYKKTDKSIVHIGDSLKGDYIMPKQKGINSILINGRQRYTHYWKVPKRKMFHDLDYRIIYSFVNNKLFSDSEEVHVGYEVVGPILWGYCHFLSDLIREKSCKKVFFLSREGMIIQKAYNLCFDDSKISQKYLYVSRKALLVPLISKTVSFDEVINLLKGFLMDPSIKSLGNTCFSEPDAFLRCIKNSGIDDTKAVYDVTDDEKVIIYNEIIKHGGVYFAAQYNNVKKYLNDLEFKGEVILCDIGWAGSMQHALNQYMGDDVNIIGCYFGVKGDAYPYEEKHGYLFENNKNQKLAILERLTASVFETLFLNTEGSVKCYTQSDDGIKPVLNKSEYENCTSTIIEQIQDAALTFIKDARYAFEEKKLNEEIAIHPYKNMSTHPQNRTVSLFHGMSFLNEDVKRITPKHGSAYYIVHLNELKREFAYSNCKAFYLESLLAGWLPMYEIMEFMIRRIKVKSKYEKRFL